MNVMTNQTLSTSAIYVALVHGTFAKQAPWAFKDSQLRGMLEELPAKTKEVYPLEWSGRNSAKDRWRAAEDLKSRLENSVFDLRLVIGHSHGGTIGATALRGLSEPSKQGTPTALITINTPFLNSTMRSAQTGLIYLGFLVLGLGFLISDLLEPSINLAIRLPVAALISLLLIIFLPLLAGTAYSVLRLKPNRGLEAMGMESSRPVDTHTKVLCISTADDEALGWLKVVQAALDIPFLVLHPIVLILSLLTIALAHYVLNWNFHPDILWHYIRIDYWLAEGVQPGILDLLRDIPSKELPASISEHYSDFIRQREGLVVNVFFFLISIVLYFLYFWIILALVGLLASYAISAIIFGSGFGFSSLLHAVFFRVRVSSVPTGFSNVDFRAIDSQNWKLLKHSATYDDSQTLALIQRWISNAFNSAPLNAHQDSGPGKPESE